MPRGRNEYSSFSRLALQIAKPEVHALSPQRRRHSFSAAPAGKAGVDVGEVRADAQVYVRERWPELAGASGDTEGEAVLGRVRQRLHCLKVAAPPMWPTRPKQRRRSIWRARAFAVKRQSNTRTVAI